MKRLSAVLTALITLLCIGFQAHSQIIRTISGYFADTIAVGQIALQPIGFAMDGKGEFYIADFGRCLVYKSLPGNAKLSRYAGAGYRGFSTGNGPAISAPLNLPRAIATDTSGILYIADANNNSIRKVDTSGNIILVAGAGGGGYSGDGGLAVNATLNNPRSMVIDSAGNIYFCDYGNMRIRKVDASGVITTVAGSYSFGGFSGDGGAATAAVFNWPDGITLDRAHNLYIADASNNRIRKVNTAGIITTIAGSGTAGYSGDGSVATSATLNNPSGVCVDSAGNLYIADAGNNRIRKVTPGGIITTVAGTGVAGYAGDGGTATAALLNKPSNVFTKWGNLYICDLFNHRVRKVDAGGTISTLIGNGVGDGGPAKTALMLGPAGIASDHRGGMYVCTSEFLTQASAVRYIDSAGIIHTIAGTGMPGYSGDGGPAISAQVNNPVSVVLDTAGNIFLSDYFNYCIRKINKSGIITTIAGTPTVFGFSGDGGAATAAKMNRPMQLSVTGSGTLYFADYYNNRIRKIANGGIISTIVGGFPAGYGGDNGPAINAQVNSPAGVVVDRKGNVYVAELYGHRIRKIDTAGVITTYAGTGVSGSGGDSGPATSAQLNKPWQLFIDTIGNLFINDQGNGRIRKVDTAGIVTTIVGFGLPTSVTAEGTPALSTAIGTATGLCLDDYGNLIYSDLQLRVRMGCSAVPANTSVSIKASPSDTLIAGIPISYTAYLVNAGYNPVFQWKKNGVNVGNGGITYTDSNASVNDSVWCVVTSSVPCDSFLSVNSDTIIVRSTGGVGIQQLTTLSGIHVYPNPSKEVFNIVGLQGGSLLRLYDLTGRLIVEQAFSGSSKEVHSLNVPGMASGVYMLQIKEPGNILYIVRLVRE